MGVFNVWKGSLAAPSLSQAALASAGHTRSGLACRMALLHVVHPGTSLSWIEEGAGQEILHSTYHICAHNVKQCKHSQSAAVRSTRTINRAELVSYPLERLHGAGKKWIAFAKRVKQIWWMTRDRTWVVVQTWGNKCMSPRGYTLLVWKKTGRRGQPHKQAFFWLMLWHTIHDLNFK